MPLQDLPTNMASAEFLPGNLYNAYMQQVQNTQDFNKGAMQTQSLSNEAATLKNLYDSQNNPLLLQGKTLDNEGKASSNILEKLKAEDAVEMTPERRKAAKQEYFAKYSESELKDMQAKMQVDMLSPDPATAKRAKNMYMASLDYLKEQQKQGHEMAKIDRQGEWNLRSANARGANSSKALPKTWTDKLASAKTYQAQAAVFQAMVMEGLQSGDQDLVTKGQQGYQSAVSQDVYARQAGANASIPTKLDIPGIANLPAAQPTPAPPVAPFMGGGQPQAPQAPKASGTVSVISPSGKRGTIPADKLEAALKAGYKKQ